MTKIKSIAALNPETKADKGHEFEIIADGEGTGMRLTVVGKESSLFKAATRKQINDARKAEYERQKSGNAAPFRPVEDDIAKSIDTYAACTIGWKNVVIDEAADGPEPLAFTPENVRRLYAYDFVRVQAEREILGLSDFTAG